MFTCVVTTWYLLATSHRTFSNLHLQSILLTPSPLRFWRQQVKQFLNSYGLALRAPGGSGCHTSRQSAHEGGMFVNPTHRPPLPYQKFQVLISVRDRVNARAIVWPEGLRQRKITMNRSRDLLACSAVSPEPEYRRQRLVPRSSRPQIKLHGVTSHRNTAWTETAAQTLHLTSCNVVIFWIRCSLLTLLHQCW